MTVERLAWDSEFFGVEIGRAQPYAGWTEITRSAKSQALACVYLESDHALGPPETGDLVLTDERVRLRRSPVPLLPWDSPGVYIRSGTSADVADLCDSIAALVPWSRFARDSRFGHEAARRMYWRWVKGAVASNDDDFAVATRHNTTVGFITVDSGDAPEIGLIATHAPGLGAGRALLRWAIAPGGVPRRLEVVTQAGNERALRLYEGEGFQQIKRTFAYHLWLDDHG